MFKLTPPAAPGGAWQETILFSFDVASGGGSPTSLVFDPAGKTLYGTTAEGGDKKGDGLAFQLTPPASGTGPWTETVIHRFDSNDGSIPYGGVFFGPDGVLYGTTYAGGLCKKTCGVVYRLKPPAPGKTAWGEQILYGFDGHHAPAGNVAFGLGRALYGTTSMGGSGNGTVFRLQ